MLAAGIENTYDHNDLKTAQKIRKSLPVRSPSLIALTAKRGYYHWDAVSVLKGA